MTNSFWSHIFPHISKTNTSPTNIKYYYYHSFQDSLWDLIQHKFKKRHLHFLVPDFYCSNVLDNLKKHGHRYTYYPLNRNLQISDSNFKNYLWLFKPDVVIIFHAVGITSNLFNNTTWKSLLSPNSLIIEDAAHKLVNPQKIRFLNDRHFVIDSLRKVTQLPGSRLFGSTTSLNFSQANGSYISKYFLITTAYYLLYVLFNYLGLILSLDSLKNWAYNILLRKHDLLIGSQYTPQPELPIFRCFIDRINYPAIRSVIEKQIKFYKNNIKSNIIIPSKDEGSLYAFPVVNTKHPNNNYDYLSKFVDTPWSHKYSALFCPTGIHLSYKNLNSILFVLSKRIKENE